MIRKTKRIEAQVYSVVLRSDSLSFYLWTGVAFSLDEAMDFARLDALEKLPMETWRLILYGSVSLREIEMILDSKQVVKKKTSKQKPPIKTVKSKGMLMKDIVDNDDTNLYEKNVKKFTNNEKKLLKDMLDKKLKKMK